MIDSDFDLRRLSLYTFFIEYFENPVMTFIKETEDGKKLVYCTRVRCNLSRYKRYLFAIVPKTSSNYKKTQPLSELNWTIFQTRSLEDDNHVNMHSYSVKDDAQNIIVLTNKTADKFEYSCKTFPIKVVLLVGKNQMKPYSDRGSLGLALETYNSMIYVS